MERLKAVLIVLVVGLAAAAVYLLTAYTTTANALAEAKQQSGELADCESSYVQAIAERNALKQELDSAKASGVILQSEYLTLQQNYEMLRANCTP